MAVTMISAAGLTASTSEQGPLGDNVNAEDVLDLIVDKSPWENPVVTIMPKVEAMSTRHEWIEDSLNSASPDHAIPEGDDFEATKTEAIPAKYRKPNWLQHFRYEVKVSNLQRLMNPYGISDQYQYEVGKRAKQIGKDIESRLLEDVFTTSGAAATYQGIEGGGTDIARMRPLIELIALENSKTTIGAGQKTNVLYAATLEGLTAASQIWDGTNPVLAASAVNTRISEQNVTKVLELMHGNADSGGGYPDMIIANPASFGHVGAFGGAGTGQYPFPTAEAPFANARLARAVRYYDTQFGLVEVVNSRWVPQAKNTGTDTTFTRGDKPHLRSASTANSGITYFVERNRFRLAFGRPVAHVPLPPSGDSTRGMVLTDVTCELLGWQSALALCMVNNV